MKLKNFHHVIPRKSDTSTFNLSILLDPCRNSIHNNENAMINEIIFPRDNENYS